MSNKIILTMMRNLITKKYYDTMDEAVSKLDVYYCLLYTSIDWRWRGCLVKFRRISSFGHYGSGNRTARPPR